MKSKILLVIFCVIMSLLTACSGNKKEVQCFAIETAYGTVNYPKAYKKNLQYHESVDGDVTTCTFTMVTDEIEADLFQLVFGDLASGNLIGYYGQIPITMTLHDAYDQIGMNMENEELVDLYHSMQGGLDYVLESIYNNKSYHADIAVAAARNEQKLRYWAVSLPDTITFEEETQGDIYCATFYGDIAGKRTKLYSIYLGKVEEAASLGTFNVEGTPKTISVEQFEMVQEPNWTPEEKVLAEYMFSSVSEVLEVIFNSSGYADRIT